MSEDDLKMMLRKLKELHQDIEEANSGSALILTSSLMNLVKERLHERV